MRKLTNRILLGLYVGGILAIAAAMLILRFQLGALI
jgi:gas vesicle protein